ncbi:MAG TPA: hypothetical protein VNY05_35290 [Candidatus Acidoferrales bacterium]|nr:hypothetical protein [Candidatus Acidoferrales bacterium]
MKTLDSMNNAGLDEADFADPQPADFAFDETLHPKNGGSRVAAVAS